MLVCDMNILFYVPGLGLAIRASVLIAAYDLIVSMTKDTLALLALLRIIQRNGIADRASDELYFETTLICDPLFIYSYELRFLSANRSKRHLLFCSFLH